MSLMFVMVQQARLDSILKSPDHFFQGLPVFSLRLPPQDLPRRLSVFHTTHIHTHIFGICVANPRFPIIREKERMDYVSKGKSRGPRRKALARWVWRYNIRNSTCKSHVRSIKISFEEYRTCKSPTKTSIFPHLDMYYVIIHAFSSVSEASRMQRYSKGRTRCSNREYLKSEIDHQSKRW